MGHIAIPVILPVSLLARHREGVAMAARDSAHAAKQR